MICLTCHGRQCVAMEDRLVIPCPACCTDQAVEAVKRAMIVVRECSIIDDPAALPAAGIEALCWVRCQTRPFPAYVTRWQGLDAPLWSVVWDREADCWRANRGTETLSASPNHPRAFRSMDTAMLACEQAAAREKKERAGR